MAKKKKNFFKEFYLTKNIVIRSTIMNGNKETSEIILQKAFKHIQKVNNKSNLNILKSFLMNSQIILDIKKKESRNPIPFFLSNKYNERLRVCLKQIISRIRKKKSPMFLSLSEEIIDVSEKKGPFIDFKNNLHKETFLKKKSAHYRWF